MVKKDTVILGVNVTPEERDEVHSLAKRRGYRITSDYIRALIQADAEAHGEHISFEVDRGGYRGDKESDSGGE